MSQLPEWVTLPQRKSPRAPSHDYRTGGMYYITICLDQRIPLLAKETESGLQLTGIGRMVHEELLALSPRFSGFELDCFVIMPDHLHFIGFLNGLNPDRPSMIEVIRVLKSR